MPRGCIQGGADQGPVEEVLQEPQGTAAVLDDPLVPSHTRKGVENGDDTTRAGGQDEGVRGV